MSDSWRNIRKSGHTALAVEVAFKLIRFKIVPLSEVKMHTQPRQHRLQWSFMCTSRLGFWLSATKGSYKLDDEVRCAELPSTCVISGNRNPSSAARNLRIASQIASSLSSMDSSNHVNSLQKVLLSFVKRHAVTCRQIYLLPSISQ